MASSWPPELAKPRSMLSPSEPRTNKHPIFTPKTLENEKDERCYDETPLTITQSARRVRSGDAHICNKINTTTMTTTPEVLFVSILFVVVVVSVVQYRICSKKWILCRNE
jgi:hypothetical protein